jgi:hypothetical protein
MENLAALKRERGTAQQQLKGVDGAIAALNGSHPAGPRIQKRQSHTSQSQADNVCGRSGQDFEADESALGEVLGRESQEGEAGEAVAGGVCPVLNRKSSAVGKLFGDRYGAQFELKLWFEIAPEQKKRICDLF